MEIPPFAYMRWAKRFAGTVRFDFTSSGVPPAVLPSVASPAESRELPVGDGDPVVEGLIAEHLDVPADHVLFVPGSTLANYVLAVTEISPGDRVLVETPAYENLPGLVRLLGGEVVPLPRRREDDYRVDLAQVDDAFADGIRVLFLTDLHNPTGASLGDETIACLADLAGRHGARILLDEVYRDFRAGTPGTAYDPDDPAFLVASSLTKVYGFGPLRAGWVLAPPEDRARVARMIDWLTVLPPAPSAASAEHLLRHVEEYRARSLDLAREAERTFADWAADRGDVDCLPPAGGLVRFPGFAGIEDTDPLCDWLREEAETLVVPGRFFGDPSRIRFGSTLPPEETTEGLARLGEAIDRFR